MSDLTKEEKDELLLGLSCHSSHEVESTFITMAQMIKNLECQLEEAREQEITFLNSLLWDMSPSDPRYKAISKRVGQLKEKCDDL